MALLDTRTVSRGPVLGGVGSKLNAVVGAVQSWNDQRRTRAALNRLSDHELEDIGLTRGDIDTLDSVNNIIR